MSLSSRVLEKQLRVCLLVQEYQFLQLLPDVSIVKPLSLIDAPDISDATA
jgi:hypothetical protein